MKKLKILISIVTVFIMLFSYAGIVKAADDEETFNNIFENATFEIENDGTNAALKVINVKWNYSNDKLYLYNNYQVLYSSNNSLTITDEYLTEHNDDFYGINDINKEKQEIRFPNDPLTNAVERTGKIYLYIVYKEYGQELKVLVKALELERPGIPKYTGIFPTWMFSTYSGTQVGLIVPHFEKNNRKLQLKIGKISSDDLLKSLKENPEKNWNSLMTYAKNNEGLYDNVLNADENSGDISWHLYDSPIIDYDKVENEAYYFLYLKADGENGTYNEYEGVTIAQASKHSEGAWFMFFYGNGEFVWKDFGGGDTPVSNVIVVNDINGDMSPADKTPSDNSTADKPIPQTGEHTSVVMIALVSLLGIGYVSYRRFKNTQVK